MYTIPEARAQDFLCASLHYSALADDLLQASYQSALAWYRHLAGQGHYHLPFFLVVDLGVLLQEGYHVRFASLKKFHQWPEEQRTLRLRYENEFLSRILQETRVQSALELLQVSKNKGLHLRLMELLWRTLAPLAPRDVLLHPTQLRNLAFSLVSPEQAEHAEQQLFEALPDLPTFSAWLTTFLDRVSQKLRWSELLREEDIFELEHWEQLDNESLRIGCRQLIEIERRLGELDLRSLPVQDESADSETAFVDETYYPTGGISEITTRGAFENLVLSELIYIESKEEIDLFDVRFVEGELLFYTRDAGQLRRKRRTIHLILDLDEMFSLKSSGYDYQFSILALGLFVRLIRDLTAYFEQDALQFHIHCLHGRLEPEPFAQDLDLLRLLLSDELQHGWAHLHLAQDLALADCIDTTRKVYAIALTHKRAQLWEERFDRYANQVPTIHGIVLPVQVPQKTGIEEEQDKESAAKRKKRNKEKTPSRDQKTPTTAPKDIPRLLLPFEGLSMEELSKLRVQLLTALVGSY
ncbi:MAG: hypothetical protein H6728_05960 [Myxococcales bacterium]|nr:hypothetical protein [Myxococcales bacterium]